MRKTIIVLIGLITLLAGVVGYIIGVNPSESIGSGKASTSDSSDPSGDSNNATAQPTGADPGKIPDYQTLLITANVDPLPLSLNAGVFYQAEAAQAQSDIVTSAGYPASVKKYLGQNDSTLYVVIIDPFKNEANLQLAMYQLSKNLNIETRRVMPPAAPVAAPGMIKP